MYTKQYTILIYIINTMKNGTNLFKTGHMVTLIIKIINTHNCTI